MLAWPQIKATDHLQQLHPAESFPLPRCQLLSHLEPVYATKIPFVGLKAVYKGYVEKLLLIMPNEARAFEEAKQTHSKL